MARWEPGQQTVEYLIGKNRLESFESRDLSILADAGHARGTAG